MPDPVVVYVANPLYLTELTAELNNDAIIHENLVFSQTKKADICFADDAWLSPKIITFDSISQAARLLRSEAKYWFLNPVQQIRRSRLIESDLRKLPLLDHSFPLNTALPPIGSFSLLDKNTLIYSVKRWKQPPLGDYQFCEDKINPPNRAYLKLWEALTLFGAYPQHNEVAIDLGASPGGWTYVMQTFGCQVTAVDKALLDPAIAALPNVSFQKQSAFALTHDSFPSKIDW
jgi:23S rRNA (cytidine2498-2'-O)-methyltransferase